MRPGAGAPRAAADGAPRAGARGVAGAGGPRAVWILAALAAFGLVQHGFVLGMPLVADDYTILDLVRHSSLGALWTNQHPLWGWYRPWSRELHFWALDRLFGSREPAFHAAGLLLWLGVLGVYFALARRLIGTFGAAVAASGAAGLSAWSGALDWVAGAQDLWMLVFALLFLHAWNARRPAWALAALAGALLSKETAGVLPAIALLHALVVARERPLAALRRIAPALGLCAAWVALHPYLLARLVGHYADTHPVSGRPSLGWALLKTPLTLLNLDRWPQPSTGWGPALIASLPGAVILGGLLAWLAWAAGPRVDGRAGGEARDGRRAAIGFGAAWLVLGALPLFLPSVGWLSYYLLLGALGGWLALGAWLAPRPRIAIATVVLVAALQPVHARTPSWEWGSDWVLHRAGFFVGKLRDSLLGLHPSLPRNSRLYFGEVPNGIGIGQPWFNPAFRVWYADSTIRSGFYSAYRPRGPGDPEGRDFFFRYDAGAIAWVEVVTGAEDLERARRENPAWEDDHYGLARTLGEAGDWRGAAGELEKLRRADPSRTDYPRDLAVCLRALGDAEGARRAERLADSLEAVKPKAERDARRRP